MTSLFNLSSELMQQQIRFLKLIKYFFGFVDLISKINALSLKTRSIAHAYLTLYITHATGRIFPQLCAVIFFRWTQFYSHLLQIFILCKPPTLYNQKFQITQFWIIQSQSKLYQGNIINIYSYNQLYMSNWSNLKQAFERLINNPAWKNMLSSPVTKIVAANSIMFLLWRIKGVSESFLVKHFSFDRFNIKQHRYYTMLTYSFSHFGFFSYLFDMIVVASFGRSIRLMYGNKIFWALYLVGAFAGGLAMFFGMPNLPVVVPQVGCSAAISSMLTFYGLLNLRNTVLLFMFPVPMWALLGLMGLYSMYEPTKQSLGGMFAGLLIYQLFKIKII